MSPYREPCPPPKLTAWENFRLWLRWQQLRATFHWRVFKLKNPLWPLW